ncbi:MAG: helix-turn-helix domain-containing protein [Thermoleophilia bacterium]|nr:helix-turn-helix domain-containing protein [Thermoleophilia bacterium]
MPSRRWTWRRQFDQRLPEGAIMNVRYRVTLTASERAQLVGMMLGGKGAYRRLKRAQILLAADAGSADAEIAKNVAVGTSTVYRTKQRFVEEGLERALSEAPRPGADRKLDASDESLLVAVACSAPPSGRARWTMQLLADEMVRLTVHDSVSDEPIRRRLGELQLKPWLEKMWCIPKVDAEYVARMEDVLPAQAGVETCRRRVACRTCTSRCRRRTAP